MSISLTPLEDKIIVKQAEAETQTASGLFIPDNAKEKPQQGEVLAVGPGRRNDAGERIPVDVKVGDKVLYSKYGGTEVHYQGEDYLIVSARDILRLARSCRNPVSRILRFARLGRRGFCVVRRRFAQNVGISTIWAVFGCRDTPYLHKSAGLWHTKRVAGWGSTKQAARRISQAVKGN